MSEATPAVPVDRLGRVHLIGVGGAGVSVVARLLAARGVEVQGSDAADGPALAALRDDGIRVWVGHDAAHVVTPDGGPLVDTVVVSSAVRETNPELAAARAAGIRVLHRSQALASLMLGQRAVAVAGAHGKTTTSAMIATVLRAAGVDASFAIGGTVRLRAADGTTTAVPGGHRGTSDVLVAEADESDGSFLNYAPTIAVVTNVEPDHLDHYGTREAFDAAFVAFAGRLRRAADGSVGILVACADDDGAATLAAAHRAHGGTAVTYGTSPGADVVVSDLHSGADGASATVAGGPLGDRPLPLRLAVTGVHNLLNATAAVVTAALLGTPPADAVAGAAAFVGTGRRFEPRGEAGGVRVVDDYAHHPTEIEALLRAARPVAGTGRVLVLFQPHLYSRTRIFADRFAAALALADEVVVTGVYRAREDVDPAVGARTITDLLPTTASGGGVHAVEDRQEAARRIAELARPGDLVLTVGAGDVTELAPEILEHLAHRTV
ncbi:UDP-N-acetylmuramate/alanine ligase [Xylanimonas cellulosilytica DSM 15894]|uniref:UDP-N-acetylmuramate--L-alanine ligase n=1 Tax=Xylanimonas cellulosilytica (strain DSM 15894 / JCM 12276 / CECT 5975 / KCTC 9989 / LMG 20990 / NBRC 107835 / XIL07) TaxID=446471 RepID=D1C0C7_XYLCX|nr:UDP-N-acetylmuramate--L-alanine ligase [Xylanimonas cellulosilytica]ACZ30316.1 UDP-N-acetylmuramate/alanine ligase [Xylanimonas cellulosilytica DSM 15894]